MRSFCPSRMATCAGQCLYMLAATPRVCSTRNVDSSILPCFQLSAPAAFTNNRIVNLPLIGGDNPQPAPKNDEFCNLLFGKESEQCKRGFSLELGGRNPLVGGCQKNRESVIALSSG